MSNNVNWTNPYANRDGAWLRGNLHTHTSPASGCGTISVADTLDMYAGAGYDFMSISDHMVLSEPVDARLALIPGIEWNSPVGAHTGLYACDPALIAPYCTRDDQQAMLTELASTEALVILNHPNWQLRPHYRREELLARQDYDGIEIFNGVIKRLDGYEISTDKWDYLLANGRRVLGFASDDFHIERDFLQGWNVVRSAERTPQAILAAIKAGNFYASSGVTLTDIRREGDVIEIESEDGQEIQVIGNGGFLIDTVRDHSLSYTFDQVNTPYVRFAIYGQGSDMAWTQPFFKV